MRTECQTKTKYLCLFLNEHFLFMDVYSQVLVLYHHQGDKVPQKHKCMKRKFNSLKHLRSNLSTTHLVLSSMPQSKSAFS